MSFETMFYGSFSYHSFSLVRHVGFDQLSITLLGVIGVLLFIATNKDLDVESHPMGMPIGQKFHNREEPEFLDAEVVPPEDAREAGFPTAEVLPPEKEPKRSHDPRRWPG